MKRLLLLGLTLSASSAFAANPVRLETPVTDAPDAGVIKQVRDECHIEDLLTRRCHQGRGAAGGGFGTIGAKRTGDGGNG